MKVLHVLESTGASCMLRKRHRQHGRDKVVETTELGACLAVNATVFVVFAILMLSHDY